MKRQFVIAGAIALFAIGAVVGTYAIKMMQPAPESAKATKARLIGSPLPPYSLLAVDGVREYSAQWEGKVQLINFWATWCPPCKKEIPALIDLQKRYGTQGLQIVGIALDNQEAVKTYSNENGINYPVLVGDDDAAEVAQQLGNDVGVLPYTVIVDRDNRIQAVYYGEIDPVATEKVITGLLHP